MFYWYIVSMVIQIWLYNFGEKDLTSIIDTLVIQWNHP